MRVFKTKVFARLARRKRIADAHLSETVSRAERGLIDADLGGGVIKQRLARPGQGRSGGFRVLMAYRRRSRAVFLFAFAKSARANIGDDELATAQDIARLWLDLGDDALGSALAQGVLEEIDHEEEA